MKIYHTIKLLSLTLALIALAGTSSADSTSNDIMGSTNFERVGGTYMVTAIEKLAKNTFVVDFKSTTPSGKFDRLRLESDHVHVAVKIGQKIRLSAEIISINNDFAEVSQVLLFLPTQRGRMPVWLLSKKSRGTPLKAAKYLEMHAPMTDYIIL